MRLVFLGSPPFAVPVFARVLASAHAPLALVTKPDRPQGRGGRGRDRSRGRNVESSPLAALARASAIPVYQPQTTRDPGFVAALRALAPDVLLVASYGEILRREMLELGPHGALNVHASLLPRHRGAAPIQAAILAGDPETGVAVQRMVAALDEGDVLLELSTRIGEHETAGELSDRLAHLGGEAAVRALDLLERGEAQFQPQDPVRATYAPKIQKDDGAIDWSRSADEIGRFVRAMTPWPGARTCTSDGREIVLLDTRAVASVAPIPAPLRELFGGVSARPKPGKVFDVDAGLYVATGDGLLEVRELKPAGKAAMSADAWLRGARLSPDAQFA